MKDNKQEIIVTDDVTQAPGTSFSQAVKSAYTEPATWMYKYGPVIWFGVIPVAIGIIFYIFFIQKQKGKEKRILLERSVDIE